MLQSRLLRYLFCNLPRQPKETMATVLSKTQLNHNCYLYKFKLDDRAFQIKIGEHFKIIETIKTYQSPEGEELVRKYTPISPCSQKDVLDVLIKIYRPGDSIQYPNGGKLTPYLQKLKQGDKIHLQGPFGKFGYQPGGNVILDGTKKTVKRIFFVAGGSGVTPCYQVIKQICSMPDEKIDLILLFANKTEEDIVLRKELESLQPRVKVHFILDNPPEDWKGWSGYITQNILKEICPLNDPETLYMHCGPFGMNSFIKDLFKKNYPQSTLFKF